MKIVSFCMHTLTCTHAYTHTYTHACTHRHSPTPMPTRTQDPLSLMLQRLLKLGQPWDLYHLPATLTQRSETKKESNRLREKESGHDLQSPNKSSAFRHAGLTLLRFSSGDLSCTDGWLLRCYPDSPKAPREMMLHLNDFIGWKWEQWGHRIQITEKIRERPVQGSYNQAWCVLLETAHLFPATQT